MIHQIEPFIDQRDVQTVKKYLETTWVTEGPATKDFEDEFKILTGATYAQAFCNGTMSLFTALKVLGVGRGDEVIVPSITFVATTNAVILTGATPVVVDVEFESMSINPNKIRLAITKKTKAIMPVHLYGLCSDMDEISKIAKEHNLFVVEDAAQAVGVTFNNKHTGTFGEFGSFSFYGNKTITTGEGGMLITQDEQLSKATYQMKNHGRATKGTFIHETIGYNFSISDLQSALGVSQLNKLEKIIKAKQHIYDTYKTGLKNVSGVSFYNIDQRIKPVHWFTNILVDDAKSFSKKLETLGIQSRLCFYPIKRQPCYKKFNGIRFENDIVNDDKLYKHLLALPSFVKITDKQLQEVISAVKSCSV